MEFKLRPWRLGDLDSLVKYANNWNVAKNMTDRFPHPYTESKGIEYIEFATKDSPIHMFAIEVNREAVGGIGVFLHEDIQRKNAELGYWLAEPFWGNNIMARAVDQMVDFAFKTYDIDRLFARPFGTNLASQRVLEKAGFRFEAKIINGFYKDGKFVDELIYAVRRDEYIKKE